jgi:hypothetical protein
VLARGGAPDCHTAVPGSNPALFSPSRQTLSIPRWRLAWHSITGWPMTSGRGKKMNSLKVSLKKRRGMTRQKRKLTGDGKLVQLHRISHSCIIPIFDNTNIFRIYTTTTRDSGEVTSNITTGHYRPTRRDSTGRHGGTVQANTTGQYRPTRQDSIIQTDTAGQYRPTRQDADQHGGTVQTDTAGQCRRHGGTVQADTAGQYRPTRRDSTDRHGGTVQTDTAG